MSAYFLSYPWLFYFFVGLFTLLVGSFLNVVIVRLPQMLYRQYRQECQVLMDEPFIEDSGFKVFNLSFPGSHCVHCRATIAPYDNLPLVSYCWLGGKCRACKHPISWRYPLVEALTTVLSILCAWHFGMSWTLLPALAFTWALVALSFIDFDHMILPDNIVFPTMWAGLVGACLWPGLFISPQSAVIGAAAGYMSLWTIYWLFRLITGKEGLGQGDFKLLALIGAWCGPSALPMVIFMASTLGAVIGVSLIVSRKIQRQQPIPFGPYLALAGWITYLYGTQIRGWYWQWLAM